ncbi:MAG: AMP-binding protein [Myxococcales bacterium]|nr:AMP-binding protein [Myxococcales bacterium]MCB9520263.1 AMP-binding protein [Myxococcales bacterium]MCB9531369.1 AMP-binding protein [Myxococcales bacterium]MCB9533558.1 AMP-binding protein [Myxococcales bacterium]
MLPLAHIDSLGEALRDAVMTSPAATALVEVDRHAETRSLSYRDIRDEAERVAGQLGAWIDADAPMERRLVAIVMSNQSRWITTAIGAFWAGATLVPVDYKLSAAEQAAVLRHADPRVVVIEEPLWRDLAPLVDAAAAQYLVVGARAGAPLHGGAAWAGDDADAPRSSGVAVRGREDVACVVYSSGTGGDPKGCMLTHGNYLSQAESLGRLFPMERGDSYFSILPTNHAIDFMCGFLMPLMFGATVVHQRTLRPEFLRYTMQRYRITHMAVVPMLLRAFRERIDEKLDDATPARRALVGGLARLNEALTLRRASHAVSRTLLAPIHAGFGGHLRYVFAGGAFVDPELATFFYRFGIPVVIGYGLTEAGTVLTVNDLKPFRADTVGRPVDGVDLEIRDADDDGAGEVWVRSPTVMAGYFREPDLTRDAIVDGWLRTGDVGYVDPAGHLHLVGRKKNMIVTAGGKNIYPEDIEAAFDGVEGVAELCVFATDYVWRRAAGEALVDEQLFAVVRVADDGELERVRAELARRNRGLADFKRISGLLVVDDELPRTASMKIKRPILADLLRADHARAELTPIDLEGTA